MIAALAAALGVMLGFAALAPRLGRRLPPPVAAWTLVPGSLLIAASTVFALGAVALLGLAQAPPLSALNLWSPRILHALDPIPDPLTATVLVVLTALAIAASVGIAQRVRALRAFYRTYHAEPHRAGPVLVLDDPRPDVFTTPAPGGRVVITSGLLGELNTHQHDVVLAHELAHLRYRHSWWRQAADLAAAINPLLRPTATTVGHMLERWADEHAARTTGDRRLVAETIAHVALLQRHRAQPAHPLGPAATGGDVPRRVRALLAAPPPRQRFATTVLISLLLAGAAATLGVHHASDDILDRAAPTSTHTMP